MSLRYATKEEIAAFGFDAVAVVVDEEYKEEDEVLAKAFSIDAKGAVELPSEPDHFTLSELMLVITMLEDRYVRYMRGEVLP